MDIARRPYTTACRFFKDDPRTVNIRWYPVAEPVECLPFQSKINSLDWSSFPELAEGVGEVDGASRNYNRAKALPYAVGLNPCEPAEVFREGETFDPDAPPQLYNADGFPLCCLNRQVPRGGLVFGGSAIATVVPPPPPTWTAQPDCATAWSIPHTVAIGDEITVTILEFAGSVVALMTPAGFAYKIRWLDSNGAAVHFTLWDGTCSSATVIDTLSPSHDLSPLLGTGGSECSIITFGAGGASPPFVKFGVEAP